MFSEQFFIDIKRITIVHEFVLDGKNRCEYPAGRGHYGIVYALEGRARYRFLSGENITVKAGDTLLLSKGAAYSIISDGAFRHYTVNFDIHERHSRLDILDKPYCHITDGGEQIKRGFSKLTGIWQAKRQGFEMESVGYLYSLLSLVYREYIASVGGGTRHRLAPAKEYMESSFGEQITLDALASLCDMSVTNFRREWAKEYQTSPMQYRDSIRLYYAKEYLESGYYTVSEIAHRCGFDDVSYFVRFFKKQTGITPGAYKKQL